MTAAAQQHFKRPHRPKGNHCHKPFIAADDASPLALLQRNIVAQETASVLGATFALGIELARWLFWNRCRGPNLAMRVRVTGAHHFATVFENLNVVDSGERSQFAELRSPGPDHLFDLRQAHAGKGQIVARREAHDAADARLTLRYKQAFVLNIEAAAGRVFLQRGEIILKNKCGWILWVPYAARAFIPRAQIAGWIVLRPLGRRHLLNRALPRTLRPVRRYQHPLAGESVAPPVRLLVKLQFHVDSPCKS